MSLARQLNTNQAPRITIKKLGLLPYEKTWHMQQDLQQALIEGKGEECLISCEHYPVITLGKGANMDNVLVSEKELADNNIKLFSVERGGDVTYHGPGQLVLYPILDLKKRKTDVRWYVNALEEAIIRSLAKVGIQAQREANKVGVWITSKAKKDKKIAAIGLRISRWCTMHGIALNVKNCKEGFALINPCGFTDIEVSSIEEEAGIADLAHVEALLIDEFLNIFELE